MIHHAVFTIRTATSTCLKQKYVVLSCKTLNNFCQRKYVLLQYVYIYKYSQCIDYFTYLFYKPDDKKCDNVQNIEIWSRNEIFEKVLWFYWYTMKINDDRFSPSMGQLKIKNILRLDVLCLMSARITYHISCQNVTWSRNLVCEAVKLSRNILMRY